MNVTIRSEGQEMVHHAYTQLTAIDTVTSGPAFEFVVVVLLQKSEVKELQNPKKF